MRVAQKVQQQWCKERVPLLTQMLFAQDVDYGAAPTASIEERTAVSKATWARGLKTYQRFYADGNRT